MVKIENTKYDGFDNVKPRWVNGTMTIALIDTKHFLKCKKKINFVKKEYPQLFKNSDMIQWKEKYNYGLEIFKEARKIAQSLELDEMYFPDMEEAFPMFFVGDDITLVLCPRDV